MDPAWKMALWGQLGAAIDMLENAVRACPDPLWSDPSQEPRWESDNVVGFWYLVYHTAFFLDYYSSRGSAGFVPPAPFTLDELDPAGLLPQRPYRKDELLAYIEYGRAKCRERLEALTVAEAQQPCGFEGR